jgi:hypothetical protein
MVQPKHLLAAAVAILAVTSIAESAEANHRRGYSDYRHPNSHGHALPYRRSYNFIPTYYPGPPWYPGPAFYGPLRYRTYYGDYYRNW